jgi:quercetin dioxygenase-like cupin family protein
VVNRREARCITRAGSLALAADAKNRRKGPAAIDYTSFFGFRDFASLTKEMTMERTNRMAYAAGTALMMAALASLHAQQTGFKRTVVQQGELSAPGREVVQAVAEIQPGGQSGKHTHPGEEVAYILEGTVVIEMQGKPDVSKKAGEGILIPAGTVHNAKNTGNTVAKVLATYVVEKGKPVTTAVP